MATPSLENITSLSRDTLLGLEWLETNGQGGYASSTLLSCHTRKYHALLAANLKTPAGCFVLLSKLEDAFHCNGRGTPLFCDRFPGCFVPAEMPPLRSFRWDPGPVFEYGDGTFSLRKEIILVFEEDQVLVRYELLDGPPGGSLTIRPFLAYRGIHALARRNGFLQTRPQTMSDGFSLNPYEGMPPIFFQTSLQPTFTPSPDWYLNFEYIRERERGYEWREDLFTPGELTVSLERGKPVVVSVSLTPCRRKLTGLWTAEADRRKREAAEDGPFLERCPPVDRPALYSLLRAGRQFLIRTPAGRRAVIAGYPWFTDWGRDALISLPGLTFRSGRPKTGTEILLCLAEQERGGLLPNFFSDDGQPGAYNTVDAPLWFFWAVQEMLASTGDLGLVRNRFWPVLKRIVRHLIEGTSFDIFMDGRGLLHAGSEEMNLTWMDARAGGVPVTPRGGYAVEVNALWYNAVCFSATLAEHFGERDFSLSGLPARIRRSFQDAFWNEEGNCLGDVLQGGILDTSVRPNQVIAAALPFSPLDPARREAVVETVRRTLLTPRGLRTLSRSDSRYCGRYEGDGESRDRAYHQGTVWPWLLLPFGMALLQATKDRREAEAFLQGYLRIFLREHLPEAGLGTISEIFDGDPPHRPDGCIAQAWSVAAVLHLQALLHDGTAGMEEDGDPAA
ncbi:MAG: glycogen debranching protein [Syntrophaceae bacterium]|nr:glycogen debranching protein [Syntrophaceae bacterium]